MRVWHTLLLTVLLFLGTDRPLGSQTPAPPNPAPTVAERPLPVLEYAIAFIAVVVVLLVVCAPARNNNYS